jgi:PKD repeat protein
MGALVLALVAGDARAVCPQLSEAKVFISFSGSESACSQFHPYCTIGDVVTLRVQPFLYDLACGAHTFNWTFSDGFTATGREITRVVTTPHPWELVVDVTNERGSVRLRTAIQTNLIIEHWPMIIERRSPNAFRFSTTWSGNVIWDFGDGTSATGQLVEHRYARTPRTYIVTVRSASGTAFSQQVRVLATRYRSARH